jgi:hypothetical protein
MSERFARAELEVLDSALTTGSNFPKHPLLPNRSFP